MDELTLRERKKRQTRKEIALAAEELFDSKGYSKTTLNDIADKANVSPRTIFSYFESKEAIIFDQEQQLIRELFAHIHNRGELSVFDALRSFDMSSGKHEKSAKKHSLIMANPPLQDYIYHVLSDFEEKFTEAVAHERNLPLDSIQVHLVAASCRAMVSYAVSNEGMDDDVPDVTLAFIEAGLKATAQ